MKSLITLCALLAIASTAVAADKKPEAAPEATPAAPTAPPEVMCETEVRFTWKRNPPEPKGPPNPAKPPEEPQPQKEFFSKVILTGERKDDVEHALRSQLPAEEGKARAACAEQHENAGGCIASRIEVLGASYREFDFETKRSLRKKFAEDCVRATGTCLGVESAEIKCTEKAPIAPPVVEAAPTAEEKKKK